MPFFLRWPTPRRRSKLATRARPPPPTRPPPRPPPRPPLAPFQKADGMAVRPMLRVATRPAPPCRDRPPPNRPHAARRRRRPGRPTPARRPTRRRPRPPPARRPGSSPSSCCAMRRPGPSSVGPGRPSTSCRRRAGPGCNCPGALPPPLPFSSSSETRRSARRGRARSRRLGEEKKNSTPRPPQVPGTPNLYPSHLVGQAVTRPGMCG